MKQQRLDAAVGLNDSWLTQSKDCERELTALQAAAALRTRLATPHRSIVRQDNGSIECLCKHRISAARWNQHARGCGAIPGQNGAQAHARMKKKTHNYFHTLGIHGEHTEPEFTFVICPDCREYIQTPVNDKEMNWATEHCRDKQCSLAKLKVAERKRPDQRFVLDDGNVITDLSFTGSIDPRAPKADEHVGAFRSLLKKREQAKNKNYKGRVQAAGETFFPVVSTCNGTLGDSAAEFLKMMYNNRTFEVETNSDAKIVYTKVF